MAQRRGSSRSIDLSSKVPSGSRRYWTHFEEEALIIALETLCAEGWACSGSFRGGYMVRLANIMNEKLPRCGILVKHIKSKLQVWKRAYSLALGLLGSNGGNKARINPTTNIIVVESDKVWEEYTKKHPDAVNIRGKSLPWYNRWVNIFGHSSATGEGSIDVGDAAHMLSQAQPQHVTKRVHVENVPNTSGSNGTGGNIEADKQVQVENVPNTPFDNGTDGNSENDAHVHVENVPATSGANGTDGNTDDDIQVHAENVPNTLGADGADAIEDDTMSITPTPPSSSPAKKKNNAYSGKRKRSIEGLNGPLLVLGNLVDNFKQPIPPMPVQEQSDLDSSLRRSLFGALADLSDLTLDDQIVATHRLAHNKLEMDAFWGMHKEARARYVRLLLSGQLKS